MFVLLGVVAVLTQECDHCETSERAYADIAPLLSALAAELGKTPEELVIYDPYFCQGSTVARLASLGFPRVYNRKEDFYEVRRGRRRPCCRQLVGEKQLDTAVQHCCSFLRLNTRTNVRETFRRCGGAGDGGGRLPSSTSSCTPCVLRENGA